MGFFKAIAQKVFIFFLSKEKKEVMKTLNDYADAFMTFESVNVLGYFDRPMMFLSDTGPAVYETEDEIVAFLDAYMADLQAKEYASDNLSKFSLKTLTPKVAVTSFNLVRVNKSGVAFNHMGAQYTWRKTDGSWKVIIGVLLTH
jgi:NTF2-like protein (DUF6841)